METSFRVGILVLLLLCIISTAGCAVLEALGGAGEQSEQTEDEKKAQELEADIAAFERQETELANDLATGSISQEDYDAETAYLDGKLAELKSQRVTVIDRIKAASGKTKGIIGVLIALLTMAATKTSPIGIALGFIKAGAEAFQTIKG